jgi:hypothetical protein
MNQKEDVHVIAKCASTILYKTTQTLQYFRTTIKRTGMRIVVSSTRTTFRSGVDLFQGSLDNLGLDYLGSARAPGDDGSSNDGSSMCNVWIRAI